MLLLAICKNQIWIKGRKWLAVFFFEIFVYFCKSLNWSLRDMELLVVSGLIDSFMNDSRQYYSEACSAVLNMYDGAFGKNC